MSKKTMTMRRVDDAQSNDSDLKEGGGSKMLIRQPFKTSSGAVVVSNIEDEEASLPEDESADAEPFVPQQTAEASKARGMVTVSVADDDDEMEEVSYEEWSRDQASDIASDDPGIYSDPTTVVRSLSGKSEEYARGLLDEMKREGKIADFRFVPMGQPMTLEVNPGRVQCLVDGMGNVINVEIS